MRLRFKGKTRAWLKRRSTKGLVGLSIVAVGILLLAGGAVYAKLGGQGRPQTSGDIELQRGLIAWWKLDGNAKDSTPYGYNGTVTGTTSAADRKGKNPGALAFNGTSDQIVVSNFDPTVLTQAQYGASWTLSAWVKYTGSGAQSVILGKPGNNAGLVVGANGHFDFQVRDSSVINHSIDSGSADTTSWHHLVGTYAAGSLQFYMDGQLVGTTSTPSMLAYGSVLGIGSGGNSNWYFPGSIDDARVYNRALSAAEVTALYKQYDPGVQAASGEKGLVGWWKLDGDAKDSTPYGDNGIITGTTTVADREGKANGALRWQGSPDRVLIPDAPVLNPTSSMTVSTWFYANNVSTGVQRIVSKFASGGYSLYITGSGTVDGCGDNNLCAKVRVNGADTYAIVPSSTLNNQNWYHLAMSYDGTNVRLYINGSVAATSANTSGPITTAAVPLCFGTNNATCGSNFLNAANIDDVRLYNRALTQSEIQNLYRSYESQINLQATPTSGAATGNINAGLVGYWPFNGNVKDATPYGDNGTVNGAILTTDRSGRTNSAYSFSGTPPSYVDIPDGSQLDGTVGSWSVWFNVASLPSSSAAIAAKNSASGSKSGVMLLLSAAGKVYAYAKDAAGNSVPSNQIDLSGSTGTWHHLVVTFNGDNTANLYVDGVLASIFTPPAGWSFAAGSSLRLGQAPDSFWALFNGSVDNVRVYNRVLSATEVQTLYQAGE